MKRSISFVIALALAILIAGWTQPTAYSQGANKQQGKAATAVQQQGQKVGMFDDDGDGIPNCQDPDYTRPRDGTGKKLGRMHQGWRSGPNCQGCRGWGMGPRDGSGPRGQMGLCDGTGPKGKGLGAAAAPKK
jgi:hypothetical protein